MSTDVKLFLLFFIIIDAYALISSIKMKQVKYRHLYNSDLNLIKQGIMNYNGREFEIFCYELYKMLGYEVELTPSTNDQGKDLILNGDTYVELKAWHGDKLIGREILQKLIGSCAMGNIQNALVITTGDYHKNALDYTKIINKNGIYKLTLYDLDDLMKLVKKADSSELLRRMGYSYKYWDKGYLESKAKNS